MLLELTQEITEHETMADPVIKILLVDDNADNLLSMEVILEKEGYAFEKAISGKDALRILLKEEDFSLILLDVRMPIMDGYETAELIFQRDKLKHIPIIFITAQEHEEDSVFKGYQAGGVDFIRKPINPGILKAKVSVFADLYRKNQQLRMQEERLQAINDDLILLNEELEKRVLQRTIELENANYELKSLNISKDKFISVISHDLRNPLTSLLASSENLSRETEKLRPEMIKKLSEIINRTSNKILKQLNELVDWAQNQRQKTNFNPEKINLLQGINESIDLLRTNAVQKRLRFENNIDEHFYINADPMMFRSIIQNLVSNAIKFTPYGGKSLEVSALQSGDMIEVCIQDFGVGMSQQAKDMLFSSAAHSTEGTQKEKGSGLGLMLVRDFVMQHSGVIKVESDLGKGTCFRFTMPGG